jgi:hypothetical protein
VDTQEDVKRCLVRIARKVEKGKLAPQTGSSLTYTYNSIAKQLKEMDLEKRMAALEERVAEVLALAAQTRKEQVR